MSNTQDVQQQKRRMIHVQVGGSPTADVLATVSQQIAQIVTMGKDLENITTDQAIIFSVLEIPEGDYSSLTISGAINTHFIAQIAHSVNRDYALSIGDRAPLWQDLPEQSRASMVVGVEGFLRNRYTPEQQHNAWMASKIADGWTLGDVRDDEKKTSPNLKPYAELPTQQHNKDFLFQSVIRALEPFLPKARDTKTFKRLDAAQAMLLEVKKDAWLSVPELWSEVQLQNVAKGEILATDGVVEGQMGTSVFRATSAPYVKYGQFDASHSVDVELLFHYVPPAVEEPKDEAAETEMVDGEVSVNDLHVQEAEANPKSAE